jgi:hypothetical protein
MSLDIKVKVNNIEQIKAAFGRAPQFMTKELAVAIRKTVLLIQAEAMKETPVKTGNLRASYKVLWEPLRGSVQPMASYAYLVHEGSKPHVIVPKNKKALFWTGAKHPVYSVNHPGFKGNPYLQRGVDNSQEKVDQIFTQAVQNVLDQINKESG